MHIQSNWHLSVMRAIHFMEVLLENDNLEPDDLSAKGYGESGRSPTMILQKTVRKMAGLKC